MASVVPNARVISPTSLAKQTSSEDRNNQTAALAPRMEVSSPMFIKAAKVESNGAMEDTAGAAADETREKHPRFVKHASQI